jgi:hypothetical protein
LKAWVRDCSCPLDAKLTSPNTVFLKLPPRMRLASGSRSSVFNSLAAIAQTCSAAAPTAMNLSGVSLWAPCILATKRWLEGLEANGSTSGK